SLYLAFQKWNGFGEMTFVGFDNFVTVLNDPIFWKSVYNTIIIGLMGTAPQLIIGIILAFMLNQAILKFRNMFRTMIFLPYITSMVAVALVFGVIFSNSDTGLANWTLQLFGLDTINWKTDEWGAKIA